jgi:leader peptidase (prepilin peptidase)/N-methyltransferase
MTSTLFFSHFIPGCVVGLFFFCLWFFSKGKAMGDGDIYLSFLLSFLIGYPLVFVFFYAAFLTGATVGVILILGRKKSLKTHIPFGPFLIWGYFVALMWGMQIIEMWRFL